MKTYIEADRIDHLDIARTHNPRRGTRRFMGSTGAAALSRAMRRRSQMAPFGYKPQRPALDNQLVVIGRKAFEKERVFGIAENATGENPVGLVRIGNEIRLVVRRNKNMWVGAPGPRGVRNIGWIDPDLLRYEGHADLLQANPRKGTRRFGGSTQAAARARRAPAPAAPAPAAAPKKARARRAPAPAAPAAAPKKARAARATKAKTVKSSLSPASLKILLEATAGTVFSAWDNNQARPVFEGSLTIDGVSRPVVTNGFALVFTDSIPEKTAKLLRRNLDFSKQRYNEPIIENLSDKIRPNIQNSVEVTSDFLEKSRLSNAKLNRGKIVENDQKRVLGVCFLLSSGIVESFDLQKIKHLAFTTGATRLEIGGSYAFFYKNKVLAGILISLDTSKGEGGTTAYWENATSTLAYLEMFSLMKPEIIKAPNLKTSPLRVKLSKIPGRIESLGQFFSFDARKVTISNTDNWLFCNSGGLSQAHITTAAQKFFSDYLKGFTSFRKINYSPDYDPQQREFIDNLLRNARNAQAAFFDRVVKYEDEYLGRQIQKGVQVITNDRTIGRLFAIDRIKFLAKYLYFDELRLHNSLLYLFYKGTHVGLITPLRAGGEIIE